MLTCQYVLLKRENTEVWVIRKSVLVHVWTHTTPPPSPPIPLSGPYDLKCKQIQLWFDETEPPAELFHHDLSRASLRVRIDVCLCMSHWCVCSVCFHTWPEREPPPPQQSLVSYRTAIGVGQIGDYISTTSPPFTLTCSDEQVEKWKHDRGRGTVSTCELFVFTGHVTD